MRTAPSPADVEEELQCILEAILEGVVVLDAQGRVQRINAEACRMLEISAESAPGRSIAGLAGERHPISELAARVQQTRHPVVQGGVKIARRYSEDIEVELAISPMPEETAAQSAPGRESKPADRAGVVVAVRDHTIGNSLREEVSQRAQLVSYGHIAAGIAHEVKNPLGGIRGAAELLGRWSDHEQAERTAGLIVREVDRISELVEQLMVFAKGEAPDRAPLQLHRLIDAVLDVVAIDPLARNVEFERAFYSSMPEIMADPNRLTQIFLNLARNAVPAMSQHGGRLTIQTRMALRHRLLGDNGRHLPTVTIAFNDTGPGIPPELLDRLATPFFTTKSQGTGLGLAVSRHWVALHGGRLRIDSIPESGARLCVDLPLQPRSRAFMNNAG